MKQCVFLRIKNKDFECHALNTPACLQEDCTFYKPITEYVINENGKPVKKEVDHNAKKKG